MNETNSDDKNVLVLEQAASKIHIDELVSLEYGLSSSITLINLSLSTKNLIELVKIRTILVRLNNKIIDSLKKLDEKKESRRLRSLFNEIERKDKKSFIPCQKTTDGFSELLEETRTLLKGKYYDITTSEHVSTRTTGSLALTLSNCGITQYFNQKNRLKSARDVSGHPLY